MWIGLPGALREIIDGASSYDRTPDLGVTEFRSLAGAVTTWAPPVQPRRLKLKWSAMDRADVEHLDRLARRVDGPGPVAVLDPLARNLLAADQAAGRGAPAKWSWTPLQIAVYGGQFGPYVENWISVESVPTEGYTSLTWLHASFPGFPVMPGQTYTWWTPDLLSAGAAMMTARVGWYDATGKYLSTSAADIAGAPLVAAVPAGAVYVRPYVAFTARGMWPLGTSVLVLGDVAAELVAGERPAGEGCAAYSITGYAHSATAGNGRYRDIGLDLVEVTGAAE